MKRIMRIAAFALLVVLGSSLRNNISAQPYDDYDRDRDVSYQTFYDELSPYGRWVEYPGQGYVWVPDAGDDFRPYSTNGHWVWTDNYEWMWVSDYDWGWAPFHYGRWDYDDYYGWYWVPGYEWSPAWVAWRDGGDYYGWAPIRPGIHISINFNIGGYAPPVNFWCFAPRRYITYPRIYDYCVPYRQNTTIINQTTIIVNNFNYGGSYGFRSGPRRYDAERYTGRINPVRFRQSTTPGRTFFRNNEVSVYRPSIRQSNDRQIAPRNFERYDRNNGGSFRNRSTNNADVRNRNDNNTVRPDSRDRADNRTFRRNDNDVRQPGNDRNTPIARDRGFERPERNQGRVEDNNNRRIERNNDQPTRQPMERKPQQQFERRQEQRQPQMERRQEQRQPQMERREARPQERPQPQFERRQEQRQPQMERREARPQERPQPQMERRQEQRQPQMERRQEQRQPQMERRQEQRQPSQQQSGGRVERKDDGGGGNNGNGNRGGRKRD